MENVEDYFETAVGVSGGYPGDYDKGKEINGLSTNNNDSIIFHAGTKQTGEQTVTNGGRVLTVTSFGNSLQEAVQKSNTILQNIQYEGKYFRHDIGFEFM